MSSIENNSIKRTSQFFQHEKRFIWYTEKKLSTSKKIILFLDDQLRTKEEQDYLTRTKSLPENYDIQGFHDKLKQFGTIAIYTSDMSKNAEQI